jgi:hypothetical protein
MLLTASDEPRENFFRGQFETQTGCPLTKTFLLPGKSVRPRCFSTAASNSSEVIERRPDKICSICSFVRSGRTGGVFGGVGVIGL